MKILDLYIVKRFLTFFFFAMLAALSIYLVVDPIENLDKFLDKGVAPSEIFRYYLLYIPYIAYLVYPVAMLLATMFCIGGLTTSNELLAMTASGIPLHRHLRNLAFYGLLLSFFVFWFGEEVVPKMNMERMDIWRMKVKKRVDWRLTEQGHVYLQEGPDCVIHLDLYQPKSKIAYGVDVFEFEDSRIIKRLTGKQMSWDGNDWIIQDAVTRDFTGHREKIIKSSRMKMKFDVHPDDLIEVKLEPEEMGLQDLKEYVARLEAIGGKTNRWVVDIYGKIARPFAGFIIIIFGVPISAVKRRSGVIFGVTISLLVAFLFFGLQQTGQILGYKEVLSPPMAAWIANVMFFVVGIILYIRAPK